MISFFQLIRYKNLLMVLLTMILTKYALINSFISDPSLTSIDFIILSLSILFITAGGYIINDLYDIEADTINKPLKVYISKSISKKNAWFIYLLSSTLGVSLGIYLSIIKNIDFLSFYFFGTTLLLFLYSVLLKKQVFIGNLCISLLVTLPIYLLYKFDSNNITISNILQYFFLSIAVFYYMFFAFLTTMIREIIKDIEDINGDYIVKLKTLPILIGKTRARNISIFLSVVLLLFLFLVSSNYFISKKYFLGTIMLMISIILVHFIFKSWNASTKKQFHYLSNLMKLIMFIGILSMTLFKFK
ncbi:MAG: geranylgeranylglycerol-phosphate geranylgeranyltransferase [Flavobacteriales bacterium]|jgi:4-hydroxybenzoate polyprenyltransferase|tara:strand:- start:2287 stop:3192 length:906 start_codon:yes stop_codon:yes gene_type:complete